MSVSVDTKAQPRDLAFGWRIVDALIAVRSKLAPAVRGQWVPYLMLIPAFALVGLLIYGLGNLAWQSFRSFDAFRAQEGPASLDQYRRIFTGSLSNHHNLRRDLIHDGMTFETENDTEVAAAYISWRMKQGLNLGEALQKSLEDLDGFFTFVVGTKNGFGVLRDPIACKPAVMAETDQYVAFGSEYRALAGLAREGHERAIAAEREELRVRDGHGQARVRRPMRPDSRHGPRWSPARRALRRVPRTHSCRVPPGSGAGSIAWVHSATAARIAATSSSVASGFSTRSKGRVVTVCPIDWTRAACSRACAAGAVRASCAAC